MNIEIVGLGMDIYDRIKEIVTEHKLKSSYVILSQIMGKPIKGKFGGCDKIGGVPFAYIINDKEIRIPVNNIASIEFFSEEPEIGKRHEYGIPKMKYTLSDFPKPFISENGELDLIFVYGITALDYWDYKKYMAEREVPPEIRAAYQRLSDLDYLPSLAMKFGYESLRSGGKRPGTIPTARQDFLLTNEEKERHNLILIGGGYCNTVTRKVLESYRNMPITFDKPDSNYAIILKKDHEIEIYNRLDVGENMGLISILPSPFNAQKVVLILAGLRTTGTQAALLALCKAFEEKLYSTTKSIPQLLVKATEIEERLGKQLVRDFEIPMSVTF